MDEVFPFFQSCRRRKEVASEFFNHGNLEREIWVKKSIQKLRDEEENIFEILANECSLACPLSGCNLQFSSVSAFERHYMENHSLSCSICSKRYPNSRLLNLHIAETHDSFFKAKVARGIPMYECLVENCDSKFKSDKFRHQHLIDVHHFSKLFRFSKTKHLSKKAREKQHRKKPQESIGQSNDDGFSLLGSTALPGSVPDSKPDNTFLCELNVNFSRLSLVSQSTENVPSTVRFGRRKAGAILRQKNAPQQIR